MMRTLIYNTFTDPLVTAALEKIAEREMKQNRIVFWNNVRLYHSYCRQKAERVYAVPEMIDETIWTAIQADYLADGSEVIVLNKNGLPLKSEPEKAQEYEIPLKVKRGPKPKSKGLL